MSGGREVHFDFEKCGIGKENIGNTDVQTENCGIFIKWKSIFNASPKLRTCIYNTDIKPECLYESKKLIFNSKTDIENTTSKRTYNHMENSRLKTHRARSKQEIKQYTETRSAIRKRGLTFFWYIKRTNNKFIIWLVDFYDSWSKA